MQGMRLTGFRNAGSDSHRRLRGFAPAVVTAVLALAATPAAQAQVYRWVDQDGVTHLSSEKPPAGVKAERIDIPGAGQRSTAKSASGSASRSGPTSAPASPAQVASREDLLGSLRNRECVIALEALERKTSGSEATSAAEIRRLQQTADLNCSRNPAQRREQEEMAAKLRVAKSPSCVQARNLLGAMIAPGATFPREQIRSQQQLVDEHCTAPVR
jgi:hypothetical protein